MKLIKYATLAGLMVLAASTQAETIAKVSTKFRMLGPNDKIVIEAFDDPGVAGVTCYLSRAKTGGMSGAVGLAEDTSDASIACRQTGPVQLAEDIYNGQRDGEEVFKKRTSNPLQDDAGSALLRRQPQHPDLPHLQR